MANDLSGDVDGLFAAAHALMSSNAELRGIIGTATTFPTENSTQSVKVAEALLEAMGMAGKVRVHEGAASRLVSRGAPIDSAGSRAIIEEAMRTDTSLPLYITVGGGLTEVAGALMLEPRIAQKFTLVWIGGGPYPIGGSEYNFTIDPLAAQFVFNENSVRIWQVPQDVYSQCAVSISELQAYVAPCGKAGAWLIAMMYGFLRKVAQLGFATGEVMTLGDSPLVLLTALTDSFPDEPGPPFAYERTGSSKYDSINTPRLTDAGGYEPQSSGRMMRLYRSVDTRLLFGDMFGKFRNMYAPNN